MDNTVERLTQFQKSVIMGSILGDGYLRIIPGRANAFLEVNHSYNAKDYVDWKYSVLRNIVKSSPKKRKGNGTRFAYRFFTRQHPYITELFNKFYVKRKKIIPHDFVLDPLALAVWYMDDGSKCGENDFYLNTQQFSLDGQKKLIADLEQMGMQTTLQKDKIYCRLRFIKKSIPVLQKVIRKYVVPSMEYKLSLESVETTRQSPAVAG
jgi:hypothetical protein